MGRAISSNKRELEKKREQKKQEKLKRKEDRKANSGGGSLEEMIAYVDENGMITSTPPDPENRQEINHEEILVSTPQKVKTDDPVLKGRVEHFNPSKGYGFIKDVASVEKYFFHISNAPENIAEGNMVFFELEKGNKGLNAVKIKPVEQAESKSEN
jgi:cold shock CspA family protein